MSSRKFCINLPLFNSESPWNQEVGELKPPEVNDQHLRTTYDIFHRFSKSELKRNVERFDELALLGQQECREYKDLEIIIPIQQAALKNEGGGVFQYPFINSDEFSFPIYSVQRNDEELVTRSIELTPYEIKSFQSPWFPRQGSNTNGFKALEVPLPECKFRPAGPESRDSDGTIILFDKDTETEYDFWQVTTEHDNNQLSKGGGIAGEEILSTGSVAQFDTAGIGARNPEIDPNGSARATGLPYLAGLLLPEDLDNGKDSVIQHAFAFAIPKLRYFPQPGPEHPPNWVYPATRTEKDKPIDNVSALAAGQRIRLADVLHGCDGIRESTIDVINDASIPPIVRIFLRALYNYGAFLVDGAGGFSFVAEDIHTANPVWMPDQVKELTGVGDDIPEGMTSWAFVIEFLNDYLRFKLLDNSGLTFAYLDQDEFRPNFAVVEELEPPYPPQC